MVLLTGSLVTFAQSLDDINDLMGKFQYRKAKEGIDKFLADPKNASKADGWYYKGRIYNSLSKDTTIAPAEALKLKQDSYEGARVYHSLKAKYQGKEIDTTQMQADSLAEYKMWLRSKEKVEGDGEEGMGIDLSLLKKALGSAKKSDSILRKALNKDTFTGNDLDTFSADGVAEKAAKGGLLYLFRANKIDQIVALDEYDVENVATLREHLRLPGMGQTHTRYFRDKLAMRMRASSNGIRVPSFTSVFNYDTLREFMDKVPAPWVLKPRTEASSMGIKKINNSEELWRWFDQLGDQQSAFLLEQFVPGDVFHVDSIIWDGKIVFSSTQKYGIPPFSVYHDGGIFTTQTVSPKSKDAQALKAINAAMVKSQGMERGVTHAEYITRI